MSQIRFHCHFNIFGGRKASMCLEEGSSIVWDMIMAVAGLLIIQVYGELYSTRRNFPGLSAYRTKYIKSAPQHTVSVFEFVTLS